MYYCKIDLNESNPHKASAICGYILEAFGGYLDDLRIRRNGKGFYLDITTNSERVYLWRMREARSRAEANGLTIEY